MIIPIGCDHAGFKTKEYIIKHLINKGLEVKDFGCYSEESIDLSILDSTESVDIWLLLRKENKSICKSE